MTRRTITEVRCLVRPADGGVQQVDASISEVAAALGLLSEAGLLDGLVTQGRELLGTFKGTVAAGATATLAAGGFSGLTLPVPAGWVMDIEAVSISANHVQDADESLAVRLLVDGVEQSAAIGTLQVDHTHATAAADAVDGALEVDATAATKVITCEGIQTGSTTADTDVLVHVWGRIYKAA